MNRFNQLFPDAKARREKQQNKKKEALSREFTDRYQIMEFNGREYLAVNGKPVVEASRLNGDIVSAVQAAREATVEFLMER